MPSALSNVLKAFSIYAPVKTTFITDTRCRRRMYVGNRKKLLVNNKRLPNFFELWQNHKTALKPLLRKGL